MNGDSRHGRQPWSVDLLADLHADGADRSGLDDQALAVLAALDATQAELAVLPAMRMPDDVAARIDAALAAEVTVPHPPAFVVDINEARRRRNHRLGWGGGLLTAAAVAVGITFAVVPSNTTSGVPQAEPGATLGQAPLALTGDHLGSALPKVLGSKDFGALGTARKLSECIAANGFDPNATPLGVREVRLNGQDGIMIILPTGKVVRYQLLIVRSTCSTGDPATIAKSIIGR